MVVRRSPRQCIAFDLSFAGIYIEKRRGWCGRAAGVKFAKKTRTAALAYKCQPRNALIFNSRAAVVGPCFPRAASCVQPGSSRVP